MDARIRYTKMRIREALISLLNRKSVRQISVKEVCELAEINRATFYKHYMDIFDLLEKLKMEQIEAVFDDGKKEESVSEQGDEPQNEQKGETDGVNDSSKLIRYLSKLNLAVGMIHILGGENGDPLFFRQITERIIQCSDISQLVLINKAAETGDNLPKNMCSAAVSEIIADWVKNGAQESPESVAKSIERLAGALRAEYTPEAFPIVFDNIDVERQVNPPSQDEIKGNARIFKWIRKTLQAEQAK